MQKFIILEYRVQYIGGRVHNYRISNGYTTRQNTRDEVEGVLARGLSHLNYELPTQGSHTSEGYEPMSTDSLISSTNEKIHSDSFAAC